MDQILCILWLQNIPLSQSHFKLQSWASTHFRHGAREVLPPFFPLPSPLPFLPSVADLGCCAGGGDGRAPKAQGSRHQRLWRGTVWGEFPLSGGGVTQNVFDLWVGNGVLWCILGATFADCSNLKLYWLLCFISVFPLPTRGGVSGQKFFLTSE